jgi:predicted nucleic acid-binding protein
MDKGGSTTRLRAVVDASVVVKWGLPGEPWREEANLLKQKIVFGEVEAYAPSLLLYEVSSVMYKALSSGVISFDDAWEILSNLKDIGIRLANFYWDELTELLELAQQSRLTVYDSSYLLLAKKINAILVTADEDLKKKGEKIAPVILIRDISNYL